MRSPAREPNLRGSSTVTGNRPWSQGHLRSVVLSPKLAGLRVHR
jgi:hypothetical protein